MVAKADNIALALEFDSSGKPLDARLKGICWTPDGVEILRALREAAEAKARSEKQADRLHLPFVSLRTRFQLAQPSWVSLRPDLGTRQFASPLATTPFGYVDSTELQQERLNDALAAWIEGPLAAFVVKFGAPAVSVSRLRDLLSTDSLIRFSDHSVRLFPWGHSGAAPESFQISAGQIACMLEGAEIFPELGPVFRIIGAPDSNSAELMTMPTDGAGGRFSLVCQISQETLPGARQPLVYLKFIRRRWATSFKDGYTSDRRIGGFVFASGLHSGKSYRFDVDKGKGGWKTDQAYDELVFHLGLDSAYADQRVLAYPSNERATVVVMHKAGVTEAEESSLDAGVPLADQVDAFQKVAALLSGNGFRPFTGFAEVPQRVPALPRLSVIKAPMVLAQLADASGNLPARSSAQDMEQLVRELTRRSLSDWFGSKHPVLDAQYKDLVGLVSNAVRTSGLHTEPDRRKLYVLMQSPAEIVWVKTLITMMLGNTVDVAAIQLPAETHGAQTQLPEMDAKASVRFDARTRAWRRFAASQDFGNRPMFLVQAADWYAIGGKNYPDDSVNKLAARRTLAGELGATVQYLLPAVPGKLDNYFMRLQAAVLDLVFGHGGHVMGLQDAVDRGFPDPATRPTCVCAIGSLVVESTYDSPNSVLAAVCIDCSTGGAKLRIAHQESEAVITDWMQFDRGLGYVAARRRLAVPNGKLGRTFYQKFVKTVLNDVASLDPRAVVFLDSTRGAKYWSWLGDKLADGRQMIFDDASAAAPDWDCLRVVRVREQAPTIGRIHYRAVANLPEQTLAVPTSVQRLFRITGETAPTYWSMARPMTHPKRGISCYRRRLLPKKGFAEEFAPDYGQHQTPRATEFAVLSRAPTDDPDFIAGFSQQLRAGIPQARGDIWVRTPSPLFLLDKVREYMEV